MSTSQIIFNGVSTFSRFFKCCANFEASEPFLIILGQFPVDIFEGRLFVGHSRGHFGNALFVKVSRIMQVCKAFKNMQTCARNNQRYSKNV